MTDWESVATKIDEDNGLRNIENVSDSQLSDWQAIAKKYEKKEVEGKIKTNQPISYGDMHWGKVILSALENAPGQTIPYFKEYFGAIKEAITNPKQVAVGLKRLAVGEAKLLAKRSLAGYEKWAEGMGIVNPSLKELKEEDVDTKSALMFEDEMYKNFGTEENFKKYVAEKPMNALMGLAEMLVPAGKIAKLPALAKTASFIEPMNLTLLAAKTPFTYLMNMPKLANLPTNLFTRAAKIDASMPEIRRNRLIEVALDNKSVVHYNEIEKLSNQMHELNAFINKRIFEKDFEAVWLNPKLNMPVNDIFKGLDDLKKNMLATSSYGTDAAKAIDQVKKIISDADKELKRTDMSPTQIQERKVQFNKELSDSYQKAIMALEETPIKNEAKMIINRNMREFLENILPDIPIPLTKELKLTNKLIEEYYPGKGSLSLKQLNRLEGDLAEIRNAIAIEANKSKMGPIFSFQIGQKIATGTAAGVGVAAVTGQDMKTFGTVGGLMGASIGLVDSSPYIKSTVANYLKDLQTFGLTNKLSQPTATMVRMGLYEAGNHNTD